MTKDLVAEFIEDDSNVVQWTRQELLLDEPIRSVEACTSGDLLLLGDTAGHLSLLHHTKFVQGFVSRLLTWLQETDASKESQKVSFTQKIRSLALVEDIHNGSNLLVAGGTSTLFVTDLLATKTFRQFKGHTKTISSVTPVGGCLLLTTSTDKSLRLWDMRVPESIRIFDPMNTGPCSSSCHVDASGRVLVRADTSGTFHFYDILSKSSTPQMAHKLADVDSAVTALRFSPQGRLMLCDVDRILQKRSTKMVSPLDGKVPAIRWGSQVDSIVTFADRTLYRYHLEFPAQDVL
ncbi:WD40 repeat [Aphelenchoides avenae]|nr:WD40 repeat [Aphelenchus avenae]